MKRAGGDIVPNVAISEQKKEIAHFFETCGEVLKKMEHKNEK